MKTSSLKAMTKAADHISALIDRLSIIYDRENTNKNDVDMSFLEYAIDNLNEAKDNLGNYETQE